MRVHVHLDDSVVARLDARVGARGRSRFVEGAVRRALDDAEAWDLMRSAIGSIDARGTTGTRMSQPGSPTSVAPTRAASADRVANLLDTTVLIDLLRGRPGAIAGLESLARARERPFTCAVNLEELYRGLRPSEEDAAARLAGGLRLAPLGRAEGALAGSWRPSTPLAGRR